MGYTASAILFWATIAVTNIIRAYCADGIKFKATAQLQFNSWAPGVGLLQHLQYNCGYISFVEDEGY